MAEYLDVIDENNRLTGEVVERKIAHAKGIRHRSVHLWILRKKEGVLQVLLQKRSPKKDSFPNCYDISSAGHVDSGEDFKSSAIRELQEELGITAKESDLIFCGDRNVIWDEEFNGKAFHDRQHSKVFMMWLDLEESKFAVDCKEVESVRWMNFEECINGVKHNLFPNCIVMEELQILSKALGIQKLKEYITESENIVFFGGAGVSTESGIPDFRSKDGLYNQHDVQFENYSPEYLLSHSCLCKHTRVFYEFYRQKMDTRKCSPNITHKVLAKMEQKGKLKAIVTQNIDGLHQKAGSKNVFEIHGTTLKNYCSNCKKEYDENYIFDSEDAIPFCECGGIIRPYVTLYEEGLPEYAVNGAIRAIQEADCLIIGGTSLQVYPAANYISYFRGKHMIVINKEEIKVKLHDEQDLKIMASLGEVFMEIEKMGFD